jgi:hypothetical protein
VKELTLSAQSFLKKELNVKLKRLSEGKYTLLFEVVILSLVHPEIKENLRVISTLYDITKASVNCSTHNKTVVLCVLPYKHIYYFVLGKTHLIRNGKIKGSISLDYLSLLAKAISKQVEG